MYLLFLCALEVDILFMLLLSPPRESEAHLLNRIASLSNVYTRALLHLHQIPPSLTTVWTVLPAAVRACVVDFLSRVVCP